MRQIILLTAAAILLAMPAQAAPPVFVKAPVPGEVFLTVEEALELAFEGCEVERERVYLSKDEAKRIDKLAGTPLPGRMVYAYHATKKGVDVGTAYFDNHKVRSKKETVMIVVDPKRKVRRIEVLAFGEPTDYLPRASWYAQFVGKGLDDGLDLKRGIRNVTGATLTARATASAARRALALQRVLDERTTPSE